MDGLRDAIPVVLAAVAAVLVGLAMKRRDQQPADDWTPEPFPTVSGPAIDQVGQSTAPRGIRNNNPGNIRWDGVTQWRGMVAADPAGFVIFDTPQNGIRAMSRILDTYAGRGVITLEQIISTWAPATENNTTAYISHMAKRLGQSPAQPVADRPALIAGIIQHENGQQPYSMATIAEGVALA